MLRGRSWIILTAFIVAGAVGRLVMRTRHYGLLIVATLIISTAPLYAQRQRENVAKLKADARNLVGIIGSDKNKVQDLLPN